MRENLSIKTSDKVRVQMEMELPLAFNLTFAPIKEDIEGLDVPEDNLNEHIMTHYVKQYFTIVDGVPPPPLLTVGQVIYPGNVNKKVGLKVMEIEPMVNQEDPTAGARAKTLAGCVVDPSQVDMWYIGAAVEGKNKDQIIFEDIGGLDKEIRLMREHIE